MTLNDIRRSAIAAVVLLSATGVASAQSVDQLAEADADADGSITKQEVLDMRADMFARLDRNGDGFADDADTPRAGPAKRRFSAALERLADTDANEDGRIAKQELLDAPMPAFDEGDANEDGVLSQDEVSALREAAAEG